MLATTRLHPLAARGLQQCCSVSGQVRLQHSHRLGYNRPMSGMRAAVTVLAVGTLSQSARSEFFESMEVEMARMQRSFHQMDNQAGGLMSLLCRLQLV